MSATTIDRSQTAEPRLQQPETRTRTSRSTQLPAPNDIIGTCGMFSPPNGFSTSSISRIRDWLITTPGYLALSVKSRIQL